MKSVGICTFPAALLTRLPPIYVGPLPDQSQLLADLAEHLRGKLETLADEKKDKVFARTTALLAM
jgi:hypothetical protein